MGLSNRCATRTATSSSPAARPHQAATISTSSGPSLAPGPLPARCLRGCRSWSASPCARRSAARRHQRSHLRASSRAEAAPGSDFTGAGRNGYRTRTKNGLRESRTRSASGTFPDRSHSPHGFPHECRTVATHSRCSARRGRRGPTRQTDAVRDSLHGRGMAAPGLATDPRRRPGLRPDRLGGRRGGIRLVPPRIRAGLSRELQGDGRLPEASGDVHGRGRGDPRRRAQEGGDPFRSAGARPGGRSRRDGQPGGWLAADRRGVPSAAAWRRRRPEPASPGPQFPCSSASRVPRRGWVSCS